MSAEHNGNIHDIDMFKKLATVVVKAWTNDDYKDKLLNDPDAVMKDEGIDLPDGVKLTVVADDDSTRHMILSDVPLPSKDQVGDLPDKPTAAQLYCWVYTKCQKDDDFKKDFLKNPTDKINDLGGDLPKGVKIVVYESTDDHRYFSLPLKPVLQKKTVANADSPDQLDLSDWALVNTDAAVNINIDVAIDVAAAVNVEVATMAAAFITAAAAAAIVVGVAVLI